MDDFTNQGKTPREQGSPGSQPSSQPGSQPARNPQQPRMLGRKQSITSVNQVLSKLVGKLGLDKRLKEHALLSLWPTLVSSQIAAKSRPLFIDSQGSIVIAAKEAAVAQELSLMKSDLLQKIRPLGRGLDIDVKGIRFDLKHFHTKDLALEVSSPRQTTTTATDAELAMIPLSGAELGELASLRRDLEKADGASDKIHKMLAIYERELRLKRWRDLQNFPKCPECNQASEAFYGRDHLCRDCYFASMSTARDI